MADDFEQTYDGRRPSFGLGRSGAPQLRGFRSKRGAPMHDPTQNKGALGSTPGGFTSNWDSIFRNTAANEFGKRPNPNYFSSFPQQPATIPGAGTIDEDLMSVYAPGVTMPKPPVNFSGSAPTAAQRWSVPPPSRRDDSMPGEPWMPRGPGVKFKLPGALTGPEGSGASDAMNLSRNMAMAAPGGASAFWQAPKQYDNRWQTTGRDELESIRKQFGWKSAFNRG